MKSLGFNQLRTTTWCYGALAVLAALLVWPRPALAGNREAVAVELTGYDGMREIVTTPSGNIHMYLEVWNVVTSENPLLNGRWFYKGHQNLDADGYTSGWSGGGTGVLEVGTWALKNGKWVFTPSPGGGVWESVWHGTRPAGGVPEVRIIAHGVAGEVKGMQLTLVSVDWQHSTVCIGELLDPKAGK
ncbi:MAG: hypothetical protein AB9869_10090 [Verrucomicrobiia bacterium]